MTMKKDICLVVVDDVWDVWDGLAYAKKKTTSTFFPLTLVMYCYVLRTTARTA